MLNQPLEAIMKTTNKHIALVMAVISILFTGVVSAGAATITGTIEGLYCVTHGKVCPVDNADPHIAAEKAFVVVSGNGYNFITNLDRGVLSRYLHKKVRVSGKASSKYNAIAADKFEVNMNGNWKTKWSAEMEKTERFKTLYSGPN